MLTGSHLSPPLTFLNLVSHLSHAFIDSADMFALPPLATPCFATLVQAASTANTLAITGQGQTKELTELVPGILNQLGPDSLANLRRLAESYQSMTARQAAAAAAAGGAGAAAGEKKEGEVGDDDDEIPDLVENFEEADGKAKADLEELE
jgi:nascent polypeptide-associated complex subunit beta